MFCLEPCLELIGPKVRRKYPGHQKQTSRKVNDCYPVENQHVAVEIALVNFELHQGLLKVASRRLNSKDAKKIQQLEILEMSLTHQSNEI